jgi:hypothetical protein
MNATIGRLLPADEQALLKCYVEGTSDPSGVDAIYKALEVPTEATPPRLAIAVAQILLHEVQGTLPQWAASGERVSLNRKAHKRHEDARLSFNPQLVCTINWADSGPGFSWPEAYHVTYLPGFDKFVVTASRDCPDVWDVPTMRLGQAMAAQVRQRQRRKSSSNFGVLKAMIGNRRDGLTFSRKGSSMTK